MKYAPEMVAWANEHVDKVHVMVFILYRQSACARHDELDFYVGDKKIDMDELVYSRPTNGANLDITSRDMVAVIRKRFPDFAPSAYLNGSNRSDTLKWLLTTYAVSDEEIIGYAGPRFSELAQGLHHFRTGRWLAYTAPSTLAKGHRITAAGALFDEGMRKTFRSWLTRPWKWNKPVNLQSVMIIQPVDVLADGGMNMCDSCPDITVWGDELVYSCRLEELMKWGGFARGVPKRQAQPEPEPEKEKVAEEGITA